MAQHSTRSRWYITRYDSARYDSTSWTALDMTALGVTVLGETAIDRSLHTSMREDCVEVLVNE